MPRDSRGIMRGICVASIEVQTIKTSLMTHGVPPATFECFRAVPFLKLIVVLVYSGELAAAFK